MQVREILENALYLSLKDRYFDRLPDDPTEKDAILSQYIGELNNVLVGVAKKNPGIFHVSVSNGQLSKDQDLNMTYIDLSTRPFSTIFRVEFLYSGGSSSVSLTRLGINDFFGNANVRTINTFPAWYNYNVYSKKMYIYPHPSVEGNINVFGKRKLGPFSSLDEEFPEEVNDTFEIYLQYFFAKMLCSQFNAPWQAQKEELLKEYKVILDSENNTAYQQISLTGSDFALPIRNTRIGL